MSDSLEGNAPEASAAAAPPPEVNVPKIRVRAADAILGPPSAKETGESPAQRKRALFKHLLRYGPHAAALAACLFGLGWAAWPYLALGHWPFYAVNPRPAGAAAVPESQDGAEALHTAHKLVEEMRAIRAGIEAMQAAGSLSAKEAAGGEGPEAAENRTCVSSSEIASKVEHLQSEFAAKFALMSERIDRMGRQIAAAMPAGAASSASLAAQARKRGRRGRGDAFDPARNPTAPGIPRPLGSFAPAASVNLPGAAAPGQRPGG